MLERIENMINRLKEIQDQGIPATLKTDNDGYIDKECPNEACLYQFKVPFTDWSKLSDDAIVYCPQCRHEAGPKSWFTKEQLQHLKDEAISFARNKLGLSSVKDYDIFQTPEIATSYRKEECKVCKSHYSIIGNASFCPFCGNKSDNP